MFRSYTLTPFEFEDLKKQARYISMFTFFDVRIQVCTNKPENLDYFNLMYTYFRRDPNTNRDNQNQWTSITYYVLSNHGPDAQTLLFWSQEKCWEILDRENAQQVVENIIFDSTLAQVSTHFLFHGACFCHNSGGVGLLGTSGAGKTTLSLELARRGCHFLSDEIVALGRNDGRFHPFPRLVGCTESTLQMIIPSTELANMSNEQKKYLRREGANIYVNPILLSNQDGQYDCPAHTVVFLESSLSAIDSCDEGGVTVEVAMLDQTDQFEKCASSIPVITLAKKTKTSEKTTYYCFRVGHRQKGAFRRLCQSFGPAIAYRVFKTAQSPDASAEPHITMIGREQGLKKMLGYLRNVITPYYFDQEPDPRDVLENTAGILATAIGLDFFQLIPGNVSRTADLLLDALGKD
ncbi:hypothetical protein JXQ70_07080 [bacterium]|nr:hypothetical protein [bacterium]